MICIDYIFIGYHSFEIFLLQKHPLICPFKNQGWKYSKYMHKIMPNGGTRGGSAFALFESMEAMLIQVA